jgi:hypothetical protein
MSKADEFRKEIELELGEPIMSVELDDTQWDAIFARTKRWFKAKKGVLDCATIPLNPGVFEYDFPPNACRIIDVLLPRRSDIQSLLSLGFFDIVPLNALNIGAVTSAFNSYSSYVQILQALETRRRIFSADPDWEVLCNKIHVIGGDGVCAGEMSGQMIVVFKKENWEIDELKDRDENLFFRYSLATAKYFLGAIRSKYKSYPSADGPIDTDGPELKEEYKQEIELLDEEIAESQMPMGVIIG